MTISFKNFPKKKLNFLEGLKDKESMINENFLAEMKKKDIS